MKTTRTNTTHCSGNALIITLIFGALIGLVLLSYLEIVQARTKVRARSLAWNTAIPVLEAGIEEALAHLHQDGTNLSANSWTKSGTNSTVTYQKTRTNSDSSYCIVTISNVASI